MSPTTRLRHALRTLSHRRLSLRAMEFFLADTCNLTCAHCAANSPSMPGPGFPDPARFRSTLQALSDVAQCRQLRFLGGEPLLNERVCEFLQIARESGMFAELLVATNGLLLHRMPARFWELVDVVRVSVYPATAGHFDAERKKHWSDVAGRHGARMIFDPVCEFLQSTRPSAETDPAVVQRTFDHCDEAHAWSCHLLHDQRLYRCSRVHTLDKLFASKDPSHTSFLEDDGLLVDRRSTLRQELATYLASAQPLQACKYCLGTSGTRVPHVLLKMRPSSLRSPA